MQNEDKQSSIFIDLTSYNVTSDRLCSMRSDECKPIDPPTTPLTKCSSPITPIKSLNCEASNKRTRLSQVDVSNTAKMQVKFRPKVIVDSPIACSSGGWRGDSSCRRVLDFGSDGCIQTKSVTIYTKGGYSFTRQIRVISSEKEEEAWWKKEQELFKQRALSFITSMRLVQGNRPFMGWKGSVVDSVVGVFLTQNTADNSSSSAFMSLAAKYPKEIITGGLKNENHTDHALDWNAVRSARPSEVSHAIQERGMNNRLAERIQKFLDNIHNEKSGLLDLEWLRNAKPEEAMEFFKGVYGLGLKSMECLRLLTLRQHAFPVDRHVSRIVVRLGWVPLEELPNGVLIHQLEEYPVINHVQEYLSQRFSNLDVETLYELHYQMITFGKVFCTKKKPNCNSCPLKKDCKHFASATTSGRDPTGENTFVPITPGRSQGPATPFLSIAYPELEDIEDLCLTPRSQALKVAGRLRTKHRVYELHDSHPLVQELDKRDPDDTNPYLLAIWPPEKPENAVVEGECCSLKSSDSHEEDTVFGTLLIQNNIYRLQGSNFDPFSYKWIDLGSLSSQVGLMEVEKTVCESTQPRPILLVPCRTATRGSFPLDGTFFQINEVFAHDESSEKPLLVHTKLLLDLTTKTLYCGTSITSIFEGMSTKEIQECFWKGYVCIRGFNMKTRAPKPLHALFHRALTKPVKISRKGKSPRKRTKNKGTKM